MFSLPGNMDRPDMIQYVTPYEQDTITYFDKTTTVCDQNKAGYLPILSTLTGGYRTLMGIVHTIAHLACALFSSKNRSAHFAEAGLGARNVVRGIVEMVPILGNFAVVKWDQAKGDKYEDDAYRAAGDNPDKYKGHATFFIYGKEVKQIPIADFDLKMGKIEKDKKGNVLHQSDFIDAFFKDDRVVK